MRLITISQFLEKNFDKNKRTIIKLLIIISFIVKLHHIILYIWAINLESIFDVSKILDVSQEIGQWHTIVGIRLIGSIYTILIGIKAIIFSDTINGIILIICSLSIPVLEFMYFGDGSLLERVSKVYTTNLEKFNSIGAEDLVILFRVLFILFIINQLYFWCMNQSIVQNALVIKNLSEGKKDLIITGFFKIIIVPGIITFYIKQHRRNSRTWKLRLSLSAGKCISYNLDWTLYCSMIPGKRFFLAHRDEDNTYQLN